MSAIDRVPGRNRSYDGTLTDLTADAGKNDQTPVGHHYVNGIPFGQIRIDPSALVVAQEQYEDETGRELDWIAFSRAVLRYLEAQS